MNQEAEAQAFSPSDGRRTNPTHRDAYDATNRYTHVPIATLRTHSLYRPSYHDASGPVDIRKTVGQGGHCDASPLSASATIATSFFRHCATARYGAVSTGLPSDPHLHYRQRGPHEDSKTSPRCSCRATTAIPQITSPLSR